MAAAPQTSWLDAFDALLAQSAIVRGGRLYYTCPSCGADQKKRKFSANAETGQVHCFKCGYGGNYHTVARLLGRVDQLAPADRTAPVVAPLSREPLAAETLDRVYRALLLELPLYPHHRAELLGPKRRLTAALIEAGQYRSLPGVGRARIARMLRDRFGDEVLARVPGLYLHQGGRGDYWSLAGAKGLLIPVRDERGLIVALRIRPDEADDGGKYRWFASGHKPFGSEVRAALHFAGLPTEAGATALEVYVTEGELKATIAAARLGLPVVSVPGVGLWQTTNLLPRLQALGVATITIAYDADAYQNHQVAKQARALAERAVEAGFAVRMAWWSPEQAKGLDDLLNAGGRPEIITLREWERRLPETIRKAVCPSRGSFTVPATDVPRTTPRPVYSLEEARRKIGEVIMGALRRPWVPSFHVIPPAPGSGKTTEALTAIRDLYLSGHWPQVWKRRMNAQGEFENVQVDMRVLFLVDNKLAVFEKFAQDHFDTVAAIQEGRSGDAGSPWYCERYDEAQEFGERRHNVAVELCRSCKEAHGQSWSCPYLDSMAQVREMPIVITTKSSIMNLSDQIADYDVVVMDEDFVPHLYEEQRLSLEETGRYRLGLPDMDMPRPFEQILDVLDATLRNASTQQTPYSRISAVQEIRRQADRMGVDLVAAVEAAWAVEPDAGGLYPFERTRTVPTATGALKRLIPLRFFRDLLTVLKTELATGQRHTRLWLHKDAGDVFFHAYLPFDDIISALRKRVVLYLDATPNPLVLRLFPQAQVHDYPVPQNVRIVQIANSLYTKAYLGQPTRAAFRQVQRAIDELVQGARMPAVFVPKAFAPTPTDGGWVPSDRSFSSPNPATKWGWWGYHTRALNEYQDCDRIILIGHHCPPIDQVRAMVHALIYQDPPASLPSTRRRIYHWVGEDGRGQARRVECDEDPIVQEYLDWAVEAEIIQAIGRGRATLRPKDRPLEVYLLTAVVTSLPIDQLMHISDLIGERRASRIGATFDQRRAELNRRREEDARQRIYETVLNLQAAGVAVGVNEVARRARADKRTVAKLLATLSTPHIRGVVYTGSNREFNTISSHHQGDKREARWYKGLEAFAKVAATADPLMDEVMNGVLPPDPPRPPWRK